MTSRNWPRILVFCVLLCFGLGLLTVVFENAERPGAPTATPSAPIRVLPARTPTAEAPEAPQAPFTSLLVLGVDRLVKDKARLEAIWVVAYPETLDEITLFGLPIDATSPSSPGSTLASQFSWSRKQGVGEDFLAALEEIVPFEYAAVVVLDETAFSDSIDFLGGAQLAGTTFAGAEALSILDVLQGKPEAALVAQAEILSGLRPGLQQLGAQPDAAELIALHPDHVHLSLEPHELAALITPLLPFEAGAIRVTTALDQTAP